MSTYSNRLRPALQNLLQRVVQFFHPRSSCPTTHISADVQRIILNASCVMISGERTEQLYIFCRVTGFTSDFLSFIDVELIRFFHGALQLRFLSRLFSLTLHLLCFLRCWLGVGKGVWSADSLLQQWQRFLKETFCSKQPNCKSWRFTQKQVCLSVFLLLYRVCV